MTMSIPRVDKPIGKPEPYVIPQYAGESITIPGSKSVVRILASAKETEKLISVFHFDGITGDPVGFHYHNHAHDIFMVTKGSLKVWWGDQCRLLSPGDFASVPPGVVHQPQLVDPHNETIGLVTPGDWVDFFRFIGDEYDGIVAPENDMRNPMASLGPKFATIKEKYDVVFSPTHVGGELTEWSSKDYQIPAGVEPYYLKANRGPRFLLGGLLSRPFITTKQSNGKFAIASIEGSKKLPPTVLSKGYKFSKVHQVYCLLDGRLSIMVDGKENIIYPGETVFIPAGTKAALQFSDNYVRFWSFSSGDALASLVSGAGNALEEVVLPDRVQDVDGDKVKAVSDMIGLEIDL